MKQKLNLLLIAAALIVFTSCENNKVNGKHKSKKSVATSVKDKVSEKDCKDIHWSHHEGEEGPENWQNLCDGFADCGGKVQSPINIVTKNVKSDVKLLTPDFSYDKSKVDIINNGHTVQFNISGNNSVKLKGKTYKLLQFHYHALSEHTINGKHFPIEVHFVHKYDGGDYAVIGIMFKEGNENDLLNKYLNKFPKTKGEYKSDDMINLLSLLPKNRDYFNYSGSLTTPPCSEVVNWYVLKNPITASKRQIEQFSKILNHNYRPIQPLNDREVKSNI